ncbi:ATP-dependent DNA helicase UvrD [Myxococcus stipitatus DSM 14675]|uniref:DNA 3'-5' helicase n=1 Tax=Myxococcus stipitatus (strain DSM 14675 / JCM 12634 / Mx s8) TaxID=1278073 RepID=L7UCM1_MYXSD|nr:ATP-dependent helicase [Myxococcus stipitatus]AGC45793.1 ATP-dependent DNA helicase UvrD [Myxococcus stipitatus DSM 14675]
MSTSPTLAPASSSSRIDYAGQLNEEQLQAVDAAAGPVMVIAGAGSGKTRTLTFRVARMLERGVLPENLLLLTFTNKAAREMSRRVKELVGSFVDVERILGGTFHHVAHTLLRRHASALGYSERFTVLDREDARDLMVSCLAERKLKSDRRIPRPELMLELVSLATNLQQSLSDVLVDRRPLFVPMAPEVFVTATRYRQRKAQLHLMDFDDLLLNLKRLLVEQPAVRAELAERFHSVLVDEYQDTNKLQGELVDLLAGERGDLTVVGDDCQSIYSFRGAHFANIIDFPERHPGCAVFTLTRNYRSTPEVLQLANAVISRNERQFPKVLTAQRAPGPRPEVVPALDAADQARWVVERITALREGGLPLEAMAVLYRAHNHSLELQLELARRSIPFRVRSGVRFFEQPHVKDVLAHLRLVNNPGDELAFKRVVRAVPGVGPTTAEHLWTSLRALPEGLPLGEGLVRDEVQSHLSRKSRPAFERFAGLMGRMGRPGAVADPGGLIEEVLSGGYAQALAAEATPEDGREEDLRQLAAFARRFEDLPRFLSELALVAEFAAKEALGAEAAGDVLTLSTVHQAKGLEWRAVFVLWLVDGRFPMSQAARTAEEEEEERRLFYVATTRARDALALVYPLSVLPREGERILLRPSRFLEELPAGEGAPYERLTLASTEAVRAGPSLGSDGPVALVSPEED